MNKSQNDMTHTPVENKQQSNAELLNLESQLATVRSQIDEAIDQRPPRYGGEPVTLVAVSKRQPEVKIDAALAAGQRVFGENRVQEAIQRWTDRRRLYSDLTLHLIGPLQTNKTADAVAFFDVIEVLDREKLARALAIEMTNQNRFLPCYIQVNTGEEPQKSGILPDQLDDFAHFCKDELALPIIGLMCIPPVDEEAAMHFALLNTMAQRLNLPKLSMGMSGDYIEAIGFGATSVRVGSAIFGVRDN
ncbi:MAG: YggS family pyridoxal phosphate-dependent enzyme [Candidatus Puniceispirillaceae bacterium]